uniref:Rho guanine nucleotide exchange factor 1 n=1 Tax=Canis lupus familiaris TaxID=9615 RepID=A0A8I3MGI2_CANLF
MEADNVARGLAPGPPRPGLVPVSIIGAEDEDFENELETNTEEQNSQFQSLEQVKRRPAHLMALLQHVALQFEPGPLLCCLHADMLSSLGPKEAKKAFLDFCHCFLDKTAVLRVLVPPAVAFELDRTRPEVISEDLQRQFVQEVVQSQQAAVSRLLEDFRSKRLMGMTPWEQDLTQLEAWVGRDRASFEARERHLAERLLAHLEEMQHTISNDEEKSAAVVNAISLYMRHLGVRTKSGDKKSGMNFFRKKVMGNRRSDEPTKTKKGLSIFLDPARWNRGEPQASDFRHLKVETDAEKPGLTERKGGLGVPSRDRNVGAPGQDVPGVSLHPLPGDSPDREPGVDTPPELGDPPPQGPASLEPPGPSESTEEGPDTERRWKRLSGRLGRSESLRVSDRRRPSRGSLGAKGRGGGRSRSDVDMDPSSATAVLGPARRATPEPGDEGDPGRSGLELEPEEPPGWRELIPPGTLHSLPKSQVKRQEVISELLVTEAAHVRMLRVLHDLFYQPMLEGNFFSTEDLQNIFPSLDELIEVHSLFLDRLMKRRQDSGCLIEEIGDVLLARFDGAEGKWFQKISSRFCSRQSFALEQLKAKQRKDPRFCAFVQEAESRPRCRRLQLKDMIPTEMQRLTKYPLLLQSIGQNTEESAEREKVELAAECCREILHHVNQAVRDMEDLLRLKDYQKRLDLSLLRQSSDPMLSEFKNLDITKKKLIYEGPLTWRLTKDKAVEVHVLLLDDLLLLLQRQDDRLLLKSHSRTLTPTPDGKTMLRPVLRLTSAITREVATDHKAFYVLFTWDQEAQIYELVAQTVSERKNTREPLLSSSENGNGGGREMPPADGQTERILSTLLPYCRPRPEGQLAAKALEKGGGGGILSPATPPVSAWGEQHPPAWVYLRLLGPGRPFARLRATRRHRTAQLPQHLQPQGSEEREPGCQGGHAWGGPAGITASPNFPLALAFSLSCLLLGGLRASFRQGGNHSDPLPFLRPSQYCLEGAPFYSPPPSAFALFLYPELEVYFLIYII